MGWWMKNRGSGGEGGVAQSRKDGGKAGERGGVAHVAPHNIQRTISMSRRSTSLRYVLVSSGMSFCCWATPPPTPVWVEMEGFGGGVGGSMMHRMGGGAGHGAGDHTPTGMQDARTYVPALRAGPASTLLCGVQVWGRGECGGHGNVSGYRRHQQHE